MVDPRERMKKSEAMTPELEACKETRGIAATSFRTSLQSLLETGNPISEKSLADRWLLEMQKHQEIFPEGWYEPPPHGIAVRFATDTNFGDLYLPNLRAKENWPREEVYLDREKGMAYVYASPVSKREKGIIGDWGMTLYFGKDPQITNHIQYCLATNRKILDEVSVGMSFKDIYTLAIDTLAKDGFSNDVVSITDPSNQNIGHTVPGLYDPFSSEEKALLQNPESNWEDVKTVIKNKRKFVSPVETLEVQPGMAFTIEPRPISKNAHLPNVSFHTIALFDTNGDKQLVTEYEDTFKLVGMDYML